MDNGHCMDTSISTPHELAADEFARRAREALGESIHTLVLYGSTVQSETRGRNSDVDMFAVLNDADREEELREIAYDVTLEYGLVVSVQTQTRERFEERRETPFVKNVLREGRTYG